MFRRRASGGGSNGVRAAAHAGSWYEGDPDRLRSFIDSLLSRALHQRPPSKASNNNTHTVAAVIGPHAGLRYCGDTSACAYTELRNYLVSSPSAKNLKRIFLLGPSHHKWFDGVELSQAAFYDTPMGALEVDQNAMADLKKAVTGQSVTCGTLPLADDEEEHSLELHLPFIASVLEEHAKKYPVEQGSNASMKMLSNVKIVPFLVGEMSSSQEAAVGSILRSYLLKEENMAVISTDFCHWGSRFRYTYHYQPERYPQIGDAIIAMDHEGIQHINNQDISSWNKYLKETKNTICGRRPVSVLLNAIGGKGQGFTVEMGNYSQSNKCQDTRDSSVSYSSGVISRTA